MRRKLPPMKSLIAFEAAARQLSITRAADELCVVPAAVSHHIRRLEEWLGISLFRHDYRALSLTDAGKLYINELQIIFDSLDNITQEVMSSSKKEHLMVTAPPSFVTKWFLPRMHRFRDRHPDIDLNLAVSPSLIDCTCESTDVGIHYSRGEYMGLYSRKLAEVELFPVCRPHMLLNGRKPPVELSELKEYTLLHDDNLKINERMDWRHWLQTAGADTNNADAGLHFNQAAIAYQAAIEGHGIVLAKSVLVDLDMMNNKLIRPFTHGCWTEHYYCLVCRPACIDNPKVAAFEEWLMDEMQVDQNATLPVTV